MTQTTHATSAKKTMKTATPLPGAYTGQLLRVDLTRKKCWA